MRDDCDDADEDVNPYAEELPGNGFDDDCDHEHLVKMLRVQFDNSNDDAERFALLTRTADPIAPSEKIFSPPTAHFFGSISRTISSI